MKREIRPKRYADRQENLDVFFHSFPFVRCVNFDHGADANSDPQLCCPGSDARADPSPNCQMRSKLERHGYGGSMFTCPTVCAERARYPPWLGTPH
jgi:hypothetical protein